MRGRERATERVQERERGEGGRERASERERDHAVATKCMHGTDWKLRYFV